jgi:glutamyl-tRNA reductase
MVNSAMHSSAKTDHVVNVRITHKTARVPLMEAVAFKDKEAALAEVKALENVEECLILQTCNRIEIYLVAEEGEKTLNLAKEFFARHANSHYNDAFKAIETSLDTEACKHLLRVTSGLESMVIGEDQILNQVWDAYLTAENSKTAGPILKHLFNRAVTVGRHIRDETGINKGAVSIGSAAVELAAVVSGNLSEKKILVIGAGEIGTLVAKALARRCLSPIIIANRTYDRAVRLAETLEGKAVRFDQYEEALVDADVVICSTSAPHYIVTKENVSKLIVKRTNPNDLIIIDISNPRNVEKAVVEVEKVKLYNIDDLLLITDKNLTERQKCVDTAVQMIDKEMVVLEDDLKKLSVRLIISSLLADAEKIRQRELSKAINILGDVDA